MISIMIETSKKWLMYIDKHLHFFIQNRLLNID
jgi:hypothetical protein